MTRKREREADDDRGAPALRRLGAALERQPAYPSWALTQATARVWVDLPLDCCESAVVGDWLKRSAGDAVKLARRNDPKLRKYFVGSDGAKNAWYFVLGLALERCGVQPEKAFLPNLQVWTPKGPRPGHTGNVAWREDELRSAFPDIVEKLLARYQREHTTRPQWIKDLTTELVGISPITVMRYLKRYPDLQQCLDRARGEIGDS